MSNLKFILILNFLGISCLLLGCIRSVFVFDEMDTTPIALIGFAGSVFAILFYIALFILNSVLFYKFHNTDGSVSRLNMWAAWLIFIVGISLPIIYITLIAIFG